MPELPEVETTVIGLKKKVLNRTFLALWTDTPKIIRRPGWADFKKQIIGLKIINIQRRAKNILFFLSQDYILLTHLKMTGHLLVGKWKLQKNKWVADEKGESAKDPMNGYLRIIFTLDNGEQLALSDLRKFAKMELWKKQELFQSKEFKALGPEPLESDFTFNAFQKLFAKKRGRIKLVLMAQNFIAGIGNIYANEILFMAKIHPEARVEHLNEKDLKKIFDAIKKVLKKGLEAGGASISDYRNVQGEMGKFQKFMKVYGQEGKPCPVCKSKIQRATMGQRSSFYCPVCQIKK